MRLLNHNNHHVTGLDFIDLCCQCDKAVVAFDFGTYEVVTISNPTKMNIVTTFNSVNTDVMCGVGEINEAL
jgi:hypothetical protein